MLFHTDEQEKYIRRARISLVRSSLVESRDHSQSAYSVNNTFHASNNSPDFFFWKYCLWSHYNFNVLTDWLAGISSGFKINPQL